MQKRPIAKANEFTTAFLKDKLDARRDLEMKAREIQMDIASINDEVKTELINNGMTHCLSINWAMVSKVTRKS